MSREAGRSSARVLDLALQKMNTAEHQFVGARLHDRLIGRPGRCSGLIKLLEHMRRFDRVWFCRGIDIAEHWRGKFPAENGDGPT